LALLSANEVHIPSGDFWFSFPPMGFQDGQMLGKNGFGYDCSETSGLSKANNGCHEMDDENAAHSSSYSGPKIASFLR
jgi:hypothetical protein